MKNLFKSLGGFALAILILSCVPDKEPVTPDGSPGTPAATGAITPVGTAEGPSLSVTIGPAGGTVASADQRISIIIPAGALTENKTISVQPITNNCPAGTGQAFRLEPHGITFAKPVSITFQYSQADVNSSAPELLRVAYQNEKGIWRSPSLKAIDTTAHTVTVHTTHFSDWGVFQNMFIYPNNPFLNPGESIKLKVFTALKGEADKDDELVVSLPTLVPVSTQYIEKWTLRGEGTLAHQYSEGVYYAPARIPATNPAAITVFLNKSVTIEGRVYKDLRLVSNVFVAPEGLSVQIDGGAWKTYTGGANINGTHNVILGKNGEEYAQAVWKGTPSGRFNWTKGTAVGFHINKGPLFYHHLYGTEPYVSGGSLVVDNSNTTWVTGTFTATTAGWVDTTPPMPRMGTATVNGVFRLKRAGTI